MSDPSRPLAARLSPTTATILTFVAAASVLVLEIAAVRLLAPYVGLTLTTYTGIIGVILAGIALGAWAGGRAADAYGPDILIGPAFLLGGVAAVSAVPVVAAFGQLELGGGVAEVVMLGVLAFIPPSAFLSAVAPMIVKATLASLATTGSIVGRLSAVGTVGAISGTFLTGFVLLGLVPTRWLVVAVGGLLAVIGLVLAWRGTRSMSALTRGALGAVVWIGFMVGLAVIIGSPCDTETRNYCVSIVDDPDEPGGRTLVLDGLSHAFVDLDDPTNLRFGYIRRFADVTAATMASSDSLTVLHVGGGGFTFPRYLVAVAPASRHVVLELDPGIVDVARTRLGFSPSEQIGVVVGDARLSIASQPTDAFDLVAGDAFGGLAVPWHLTTREFLVEIDRVLRPGGVYVMNLIDAAPLRFVRAEARTARSVFGNVAIVGRPSAGTDVAPGNVVLVASQAPIDAAGIEARIASWAEPADTAVMSDPARVDAFIGDAAELTDDYAPVDQLLGR